MLEPLHDKLYQTIRNLERKKIENLKLLSKKLIELNTAQEMLNTYRQNKVDNLMKNFTQKTKKILGDDWEINDQISTGSTWYQVFDTYLDSCRVADLTAKLADKVALTKELEEDIENGTKAINQFVENFSKEVKKINPDLKLS